VTKSQELGALGKNSRGLAKNSQGLDATSRITCNSPDVVVDFPDLATTSYGSSIPAYGEDGKKLRYLWPVPMCMFRKIYIYGM
jgi:hypothetical protein